MSEQHEEFHDANTPEDRLMRYRWALAELNEASGELIDTEKVYIDTLINMGAVLETLGIDDPHKRNILLGGVVPGPFDPRLRKIDDWIVDLRLIPLRLIDKETPPIETYTARYLSEAFATALDDEYEHGETCLEDEEGGACDGSGSCPAAVAAEIGLRQLGLLVFDLHTFTKPDDDTEIERVEKCIEQIRTEFDRYGLADKRAVNVAINEMNRVAWDILRAVTKPKHRKQD